MAEFKFPCPLCGQHMILDELWRGRDVECPSCHQEVAVPQADAPPAPPSSGARIVRPQTQAGAPAPIQTRFTGQRPPSKAARSKSGVKKLAIIGGVLIVLGAGAWFGIPKLLEWQDKVNAKRQESAKHSDGGEMGHIADLYKVEAATEPGGPGLGSLNRRTGQGPRQRPGAPAAVPVAGPGNAAGAPVAAADAPVVRPVWTLEPLSSSIPEGRPNGLLAGTNFLAETVRIDPVGSAQVLRLTQGPVTAPDREFLVYLHPKPGEALPGHSWDVSKDMMTGSSVPQIKTRWKPSANLALQLKTFDKGYALKLEFGQLTNGVLPGKIFLALPDTEQSVVAGAFNASITAPSPVSAAAPIPTMPSPARRPDRYGPPR